MRGDDWTGRAGHPPIDPAQGVQPFLSSAPWPLGPKRPFASTYYYVLTRAPARLVLGILNK